MKKKTNSDKNSTINGNVKAAWDSENKNGTNCDNFVTEEIKSDNKQSDTAVIDTNSDNQNTKLDKSENEHAKGTTSMEATDNEANTSMGKHSMATMSIVTPRACSQPQPDTVSNTTAGDEHTAEPVAKTSADVNTQEDLLQGKTTPKKTCNRNIAKHGRFH